MITRSKNGITKPKVFSNVKHPLPIRPGPIEPTSVQAGLIDPDWRTVMQVEFDALQCNSIWDLVPFDPSYNVVGNK